MEEFGVLSGMAANGTGDLGTCQDDFCDAGVDGYEKYVSGIFGWVHDKAVSLSIAVVSDRTLGIEGRDQMLTYRAFVRPPQLAA